MNEQIQGTLPPMSLLDVLASVPDPRQAQGRRHPLGAVLALAVCAMVCGARSLYAIAQWGRDHGDSVPEALGFRRTTPSVATLHRVFRRLDREDFEERLGQWLQQQGLKPGEALAVDGKTLRGIHGEEVPGVHLVAALTHQSGLVIDQQATEGKGQELAAVHALLERLPLKGRIVTGDALLAQRDCSVKVVEKGGTISGS